MVRQSCWLSPYQARKALQTMNGSSSSTFIYTEYIYEKVPVLTDADPGVIAAIARVLPSTLHFWCLWHLLQNRRNNLDKHITPNVRFWAGFNHTRFSTGAVSS
mmetsp:Transcript_26560/g.74629  ORF Transcript_26560/g.74629 Transcript_26560/m.74629 type:complete len:103 (-) Transcript_26560:515-823(-)